MHVALGLSTLKQLPPHSSTVHLRLLLMGLCLASKGASHQAEPRLFGSAAHSCTYRLTLPRLLSSPMLPLCVEVHALMASRC